MTTCIHCKKTIEDYETINALKYDDRHFDCMKRNRQRWRDEYTPNNFLFDKLVNQFGIDKLIQNKKY